MENLPAASRSAGGAYIYLKECYGRRIAFLFGWMCLLVMDPAITASLATGLAGYFAYIVPLPPLLIKLVGVAVIWALCLHEHLQYADERGILALDHLAEARVSWAF